MREMVVQIAYKGEAARVAFGEVAVDLGEGAPEHIVEPSYPLAAATAAVAVVTDWLSVVDRWGGLLKELEEGPHTASEANIGLGLVYAVAV